MSKAPLPQRAWLLVKGKRKAECLVDLHPLGWEVRYHVDGHMRKTQVCKTQDAMLDEVEDGKKAFVAKGWVEPEKNASNGRLPS